MKRDKVEILRDLIRDLSRMVQILKQDSRCSWTRGFEGLLDEAIELRENGCPEQLFRDFCGSVRHILSGGMGSFNDFFPMMTDPKTGERVDIPETEDFDDLRNRIYDLANEFRTIGSY